MALGRQLLSCLLFFAKVGINFKTVTDVVLGVEYTADVEMCLSPADLKFALQHPCTRMLNFRSQIITTTH